MQFLSVAVFILIFLLSGVNHTFSFKFQPIISRYSRLFAKKFPDGFVKSDKETAFINAFSNVKFAEKLPGNVDVFEISPEITEIWNGNNEKSYLYAREFYPRLVSELFKNRKDICLTGNPGNGKSYFQMYLMLAMLNQNALPTEVPGWETFERRNCEFIVRQNGDLITLYDLVEKVGYDWTGSLTGYPVKDMPPEKVMFLYEPNIPMHKPIIKHPKMWGLHSISFADLREKVRILEKHSINRFMPCYELDELQGVASHMRKTGVYNERAEEPVPEWVAEKFKTYGPSFFHVLVSDNYQRGHIDRELEIAMRAATRWYAANGPHIFMQDGNHQIIEMVVNKTEGSRFKDFDVRWLSESIRERMTADEDKVDEGEIKPPIRYEESGISSLI